ncbi:hypothetical protein AB0D04_13660 [Streptomyces sp. NPDC048483]|uniref:hypothetical protein n=1 Tax=Streptomyces sp. NPDC048483 TaxID=3154927 RepID=UPI003439C022
MLHHPADQATLTYGPAVARRLELGPVGFIDQGVIIADVADVADVADRVRRGPGAVVQRCHLALPISHPASSPHGRGVCGRLDPPLGREAVHLGMPVPAMRVPVLGSFHEERVGARRGMSDSGHLPANPRAGVASGDREPITFQFPCHMQVRGRAADGCELVAEPLVECLEPARQSDLGISTLIQDDLTVVDVLPLVALDGSMTEGANGTSGLSPA